MKALIKITQEVEIKTLRVIAYVRYPEDATVNEVKDTEGTLMPGMDVEKKQWSVEIDIDTGIIKAWQQGIKADIHYKVCDGGNYYLLDGIGNVVMSREDNYVPDILCPKGKGYGDYIIMSIDETGKISNWNPDIKDFYKEEE